MSNAFAQKPTHSPGPPSQSSPSKGAGTSRAAERGQPFAQAEAARQPATGPQPIGSVPAEHAPIDWALAPSTDASRKGKPMFGRGPKGPQPNQDQRVRELEAKTAALNETTAAQQQKIADMEARVVALVTANIREILRDASTFLATADATSLSASDLLETLVQIDGQGASAERRYQAAGKAYKESKKVGALDVVGGLIDAASGVKAVLQGLAKVKSLVTAAEASTDVLSGGKSVFGGVGVLVDRAETDRTFATDETSQLVDSLHGILGPMQHGALATQSAVVLDNLGDAQRALLAAKGKLDIAVNDRLCLIPVGTPERAEIEVELRRYAAEALGTIEAIQARFVVISRLNRARMAGAQAGLSKGTATRSLLDELLDDDVLRQRATLIVETQLEVRLSGEEEVVRAYRLDTGDAALDREWSAACGPEVAADAVRSVATKMAYISRDMGIALQSNGLKTTREPPRIAVLMGVFAEQEVPIDQYRANAAYYLRTIEPDYTTYP